MEYTFFEVLWYFLVFLLIAGYFILDGFDLGIGVLSPFIAKNEEELEVLRRAIGPVWDGNEVWLITAGGALFAAFPDAYATTFSGFYLAIMLVLFGLIVRAVSFEFHSDSGWGKVWDVCFFIGSLLPALLTGVAVGNIFQGIPMDADGNYTGIPLLGLISPFTLLTGVLGLVMMLSAGACWTALKAPKPSALQARCAKLRIPLQVIAIILFIVLSIYALIGVPTEMAPELGAVRWIFAILTCAALIVSIIFGAKGSDLGSFLSQSVSAATLVFLLATSMFPNMVMASADSVGAPISIATAASSDLALICMTIILCIGLPLVLLYHVVIYRTFRGRVDLHESAVY